MLLLELSQKNYFVHTCFDPLQIFNLDTTLISFSLTLCSGLRSFAALELSVPYDDPILSLVSQVRFWNSTITPKSNIHPLDLSSPFAILTYGHAGHNPTPQSQISSLTVRNSDADSTEKITKQN